MKHPKKDGGSNTDISEGQSHYFLERRNELSPATLPWKKSQELRSWGDSNVSLRRKRRGDSFGKYGSLFKHKGKNIQLEFQTLNFHETGVALSLWHLVS